jgi:hypothetical protein
MGELAGLRKAFSEKMAERQSVMEPYEDPDYENLGPASRPGRKTTVTRCCSRLSRRSRHQAGSPSAKPKLANASYECHDGREDVPGDAARNLDD